MNETINDDVTMREGRAPSRSGRLSPGDEILGRYAVQGELGQGGMGVVYRCLDKVGGVEVAVKGLPPEVSHSADEMAEIRDNYRLVEGLRHENICGIKTLEADAAGDYFLVMDLAHGDNLNRWMRKHADAPFETKLAILRQIASALDYAHVRKIIHRDVKPENIMVAADGHVSVLDFGLAAQIRSSLSRTSQAVTSKSGTPTYKSPEQWLGRPQSAAADQYALGVIAYRLFAGELPFDGDDLVVLGQAVLTAPVPAIPGVPRSVNAALARALAKKPADRHPSCSAFLEALVSERKGHRFRIGLLLGLAGVVLGIGALGTVIGVTTWALLRPKSGASSSSGSESVSANESPSSSETHQVVCKKYAKAALREALEERGVMEGTDEEGRVTRIGRCRIELSRQETGSVGFERKRNECFLRAFDDAVKCIVEFEMPCEISNEFRADYPASDMNGEMNTVTSHSTIHQSLVLRGCSVLLAMESLTQDSPTSDTYEVAVAVRFSRKRADALEKGMRGNLPKLGKMSVSELLESCLEGNGASMGGRLFVASDGCVYVMAAATFDKEDESTGESSAWTLAQEFMGRVLACSVAVHKEVGMGRDVKSESRVGNLKSPSKALEEGVLSRRGVATNPMTGRKIGICLLYKRLF